MKRLFSVLTAAVCIAACALPLAACGGKEHTEHSWSATYTEEGDRHYQTCDGCDEKKYSDHSYNGGGVCVCGKRKPEEPIAATGVALNETTLTLEIDGTATLTATVSPENATDKSVTWESDKPEIASVNESGKVTAQAAGTAIITAKTVNNKTATCTVTVNKAVVPVTGVALNETSLTLEIGDETTLTATISPDDATDKTVTWESDKPDIASVNQSGKVTAQAAGTAIITAKTANNQTATCTVTVNAPITNAQVIAALNEKCKNEAVQSCFTFDIETNKISNGKWYVTKDNDGKIASAEYRFNYRREVGMASLDYYAVGKVNFNEPVNARDIVEKKFDDVTYEQVYKGDFHIEIQDTRKDFTDAICDKVFETNGTVKNRYLIDDGYSTLDKQLPGEINMFKVIEVTDIGVREARMNIKYSETDAGYIAKLENESNYRVFNQKSQAFTGTEIPDNDEEF